MRANNVETESWAVFGHLEYDFNENWGVIAALRYTEDKKDTVFESTDILGGNVTGLGFTLAIPFDLSADPDLTCLIRNSKTCPPSSKSTGDPLMTP